jgi:hypothetical protein
LTPGNGWLGEVAMFCPPDAILNDSSEKGVI